MRSSFISFIKELNERYGIIHVFSEIEHELKARFPHFFLDPKCSRRVSKTYSSACSIVRKEIVEANENIKIKSDLKDPAIQKCIKQHIADSPAKFISNGRGKTIVLQLKDGDKVFFKFNQKGFENLKELYKYWTCQSLVQNKKTSAIRAFFTAEMIEEYYRIFSEVRGQKEFDDEKMRDNRRKLEIYKELDKGMD